MGDIPRVLVAFTGLLFTVPLALVSGIIYSMYAAMPGKRLAARRHGAVFMFSSRYVVWVFLVTFAMYCVLFLLSAIIGEFHLPDLLEWCIILVGIIIPGVFGMRAAKRFYRSFPVGGEQQRP